MQNVKKLNREDYQFRKKTGQELIKTPGQINGLDFVISNCEDCTIYICDHTAQIFVDLSKNCKIYIGPVEGSIFIRKCENLEVSSASSQFRVSNSNNIKCFIYTQSDPALEKSTEIAFAPYNFSYPQITEHFNNAKLNPEQNKWSEVFDFTPNFEKRNWFILNPNEYTTTIKEIEGFAESSNHPVPIPIAYGGTCTKKIIVGSEDANSQEKGGLGFDFVMGKTNIEAQEQVVEEQIPIKLDEKVGSIQDLHNLSQGAYINQQETKIEDNFDANSNQAQCNMMSYQTFSAFDEVNLSQKQLNEHTNQFINQQRQNEELERQQKEKKRQAAKEYLQKFQLQLNQEIKQRQIVNREITNTTNNQEQFGWIKIQKNIDKDNGGKQDVSKMFQAILNKTKEQQF